MGERQVLGHNHALPATPLRQQSIQFPCPSPLSAHLIAQPSNRQFSQSDLELTDGRPQCHQYGLRTQGGNESLAHHQPLPSSAHNFPVHLPRWQSQVRVI